MCGIAGCVTFDGSNPVDVVMRIVPILAHRGPDGEGIWSGENAAVAHRRLSVIDLEAGKQPMSNDDGTVTITYNGELYNFKELRRDLLRVGHTFRTNSDTEVIIHAYEEWGDSCVERFRGMFSFGILDMRNHRLFLARDHLGIKPLVYSSSPGRFAFASEIQALKAAANQPLDIDLQSIDQFLWLQYIPAPQSIFRQIRKLLPGHRMSVTFDGKISEPEEYWRFEFQPVLGKSEQDWIDEVDAALHASVKAHLVSDVPFGAFLSGGVDSSMVVAYMARDLDKPVETFSIGYAESEYSELSYAETAAKRWGTNHHVEIVRPDALGILPDLVRHFGEPFGDSSAVPTYYVSRMARRHATMVLSGDGGDEMFAGYQSYTNWLAYLGREVHKPFWKKALYPLAVNLFPERFPPIYPHGASLANWLRFITYFSTPLRARLWKDEHRSALCPKLELFEREFRRAANFSDVNTAQYLDIKTYLPFDILAKVDVSSMMNSLEVRTPLVDVRVAELAAQVPSSLNLSCSNGVWTGKRLLKKVMERYYPADFVYREKMGFSVPVQEWFGPGGDLQREVLGRLTGKDAKILQYFNENMVRRVISRNNFGHVWQLLFLEEWLIQNT